MTTLGMLISLFVFGMKNNEKQQVLNMVNKLSILKRVSQ